MDARVAKLEALAEKTDERLAGIEKELSATKVEFYKALGEQTWKIIGAFALLASVTFWIAKNVT